MKKTIDYKRRLCINYVGLALFIGVFFNFIYDVLKQYGFNSPEWFWYVGVALETTLLYIALRIILGSHWILNLAIYIMCGVLIKELIGNPLNINFIEYPVIIVVGLLDRYYQKKQWKF